jgi:hypothetical protein
MAFGSVRADLCAGVFLRDFAAFAVAAEIP